MMLIDRYSWWIVGRHLSEDMTEALVLKTLIKTIRTRRPEPSLLYYTDRGTRLEKCDAERKTKAFHDPLLSGFGEINRKVCSRK